MVRILVEKGADTEIQGNGWTALMWAVSRGNEEVAQLLQVFTIMRDTQLIPFYYTLFTSRNNHVVLRLLG